MVFANIEFIKFMEKIFKFKSRKEWGESAWLNFLKDIKKTKSEKKLKELLNVLISAKEKNFIIRRLMAVYLIKKGKSYKEIGDILWISPTTISAIKKSIFKKSDYQARISIVKSDKDRKKIEKLNIDFDLALAMEDFLRSASIWMDKYIPSKAGNGRWKYFNERLR